MIVFTSRSFEYYDPTENWIEFRTINEIAEMNFEFENWLIENGFYFVEAAGDASQAYQQWKTNTGNKLKSTLQKFAMFSLQQIAKDQRLLQTNKELCTDIRRFPCKNNISMKSAPNYPAALTRLSKDVTIGLSSINLTDVDTNNKNPKTNEKIKKVILPSYDGKSEFKKYAKNYFYGGEGNRANLNAEQCSQILPLAYQFCATYKSRLDALEGELTAIAKFINSDTSDAGLKTSTSNDLQKLQSMQQKNSNLNQMASSNPNQNLGMAKPVNADTNYEYFMKYYFDKDINTLNEDIPMTQHQTISGQKPANPPQSVTKNSAPAGVQVNTKALSYKKKQVVADTVIDAFNAKISALGMIYHDFIYLIRAHVASYKGAVAGNDGRVQQTQPMNNNIPQQNNPQQQQPQQMK